MRAAALLRQSDASNDIKTLKCLEFITDSGSTGRSEADLIYTAVKRSRFH